VIGPRPIAPLDVDDVVAARELFWHNAMREILTSLSVASLSRPPRPGGRKAKAAEALFDGRLAVLTRAGERIPIAEVFPLFACGINGGDAERALSIAVECTVFQIRTPDGQVYTLPLHEMRAFHALSPEIMKELQELARRLGEEDDQERIKRPFGFAAFTSHPRTHPPPDEYYPPVKEDGKAKGKR
jgi:hypothetical protein